LRTFLCVLAAVGTLQAAGLPAWWRALPDLPRLESAFVQASESAVFGQLRKEGTLQLSKGGRLRVAYQGGMVLVADGTDLVQYDPQARTAQRLSLDAAVRDMLLLNILVDPGALESAYLARSTGADQVTLDPRRKDLARITVEGRNGFLRRVTWVDATGATQVLELKNPRVPPRAFPPSTFTFKAPAGVRWIK